MNWDAAISREWAMAVIAGFPLLLLLANELMHRALRRRSPLTPTLRSIRNLLIPVAGAAAMAVLVLQLPAAHAASRVTLSLLWIAALIALLQFINDVVFGAARAGTWRANVPSLFRDVVRSLLVGLGAALIFSKIWGGELAGALTALGVGSLVIGLALQEPLGNVFSGLMLLFERPVSLGDWIQVDSRIGRVVEMNWRAVNMETVTREMIIVPNSALYKTSFANLSRPTAMRTLVVETSFSFGDAPSRVKQVLQQLAAGTPGVLADPAPAIRILKYGDFAIDYEVHLALARQEDMAVVRDEFLTRLWYASQRAGLTIPYPITTEITAEAKDFQVQPRPDPKAVLATHHRFQEALHTPDLHMTMLTFTSGEALLRQGDEQDGLCLILEGTAAFRVTAPGGDAVEIGRLAAGDFYGEHSILAGGVSNAALVALSDVRVALFDLESSRKLVENSPKLAREVGETIDRRRNAVQAAMRNGAGR